MGTDNMIGESISDLKDYFTISAISEWIYENYGDSVSDYEIRKYLKKWCKHDKNGVWYKYKDKK